MVLRAAILGVMLAGSLPAVNLCNAAFYPVAIAHRQSTDSGQFRIMGPLWVLPGECHQLSDDGSVMWIHAIADENITKPLGLTGRVWPATPTSNRVCVPPRWEDSFRREDDECLPGDVVVPLLRLDLTKANQFEFFDRGVRLPWAEAKEYSRRVQGRIAFEKALLAGPKDGPFRVGLALSDDLKVIGTYPGFSPEDVGIVAGDRVVAFQDEYVATRSEFLRAITHFGYATAPPREAVLTIERDGHILAAPVEVHYYRELDPDAARGGFGAFFLSAADMALFGFGPQTACFLLGIFDRSLDYEQCVEDFRLLRRQMVERHPNAAIIGDLVGTVTGPPLLKFRTQRILGSARIGHMVRGAAGAAAHSALVEVGRSDGVLDLEAVVESALHGSAFGAILGGALGGK